MAKTNNIIFLNQMAGPLFREFAEDMSLKLPKKSVLFTGHPDTLKIGSSVGKLKISRAPIYNRKSNLSKALSWINYSLFVLWKMLNTNKKTAVIISTNPPILGVLALIVNFFKKTPYVVIVYDMHLDISINFGLLNKKSFFVKLWRLINRKVWNKSVGVYTIGHFMAKNLKKQFEVKKTKLAHVGVAYPWVDTKKIKPIPKIKNPLCSKFGQKGKITILYSGNMGVTHDINSILEAAKILNGQKNISFLLFGEGERWKNAINFQKKNNLKNLQIFPFQSEEKLPYTMPLADIALVSLDIGAEGYMLPSKMFYYMSAGAAVIGICKGNNDVSKVIQSADCGMITEPNNPRKLANIIKLLSRDKKKLQNFKKKSRKTVLAKYSRKACSEKLNKEILSLIN